MDLEFNDPLLPPFPLLEGYGFVLTDMYMKGDDIQKMSVIQALPQLLQYDSASTLQRIIPKIQQDLPKSSCEFHVAASKVFRLLIEKRIPLNLLSAVIDGCKSKDPIVSNAWNETLIGIIPILTQEQIKHEVVPLAVTVSQSQNPVYFRGASCKILGGIATHPTIDSIYVKTNILPLVQSLCQDICPDVRAAMCTNLHLIAQGLGQNLVKQTLLPNLVELASDDNMIVRSSAITAVVLVTPYLDKQTKINTIVPLFKQLCQKSLTENDTTYMAISTEFGRMVVALNTDLDANNGLWFLQFYKTLSKKGALGTNYTEIDPVKAVYCREQCGYNLPAMTLLTITQLQNQIELWHSIFRDLTNDSCYLVRKTVAGCCYDIIKLLNVNCYLIKQDLIRLLCDDAEEVLQMIVDQLGMILELLCDHNVLSRDTPNVQQITLDITRAILKCKYQLTKTHNWRARTNLLKQLEHLPNCMPSNFLHQHFTPVLLKTVFDARAKPEKSQAVRTLLIFLRYNSNEMQRKWIRDNLINGLCYSNNCYTRNIFIKLCIHALHLFSYNYFKKHFIEHLIKLGDDPVSNLRYCFVDLLPLLYKTIILPDDRKIQLLLDNAISKIDSKETSKDVRDLLKIRKQQLKHEVRFAHDDNEEKRRIDDENQIEQGKSLSRIQMRNDSMTIYCSTKDLSKNNANAPSRSSLTKQQTPTSGSNDMSFLEQHFYIDAGINLLQHNLDLVVTASVDDRQQQQQLCTNVNDLKIEDDGISTTVSIENVNKIDLKQLQQTTNITDDVKVNLRRMKQQQQNSRIQPPKIRTNKRHSSILTTTNQENNNKTINRRSLNISSASSSSSSASLSTIELSKIPVCLRKSKSNADVKKIDKKMTILKNTNIDKKSIKQRPKSEIIRKTNIDKILINNDNNNVPIQNSIKEIKASGLPILKKNSGSKKSVNN